MLLAVAINSMESIQAFAFYLMQYTISNLNAFIILLGMGYFIYPLMNGKHIMPKDLSDKKTLDGNNSPIQLTIELKGFFHLNPTLAISLAITLFSFVGIPPLIGFFGKQMVLSAALDSGFIFLTITAIITSVISAVYYLGFIKYVFFDENDYILYNEKEDTNNADNYDIVTSDTKISTYLSITISILTLILLLFMFASNE